VAILPSYLTTPKPTEAIGFHFGERGASEQPNLGSIEWRDSSHWPCSHSDVSSAYLDQSRRGPAVLHVFRGFLPGVHPFYVRRLDVGAVDVTHAEREERRPHAARGDEDKRQTRLLWVPRSRPDAPRRDAVLHALRATPLI
jgi:hypothetical protein